VADVSAPGKPTASEELDRIEEALVESLLNATGNDVRQEILDSNGDPEALIAAVGAAITSARAALARQRLERARAELTAWRAKGNAASGSEREAARTRFGRLRSGLDDPGAKITMAARKGEGLSDNDLEGLIDDMAELQRLERDESDG